MSVKIQLFGPVCKPEARFTPSGTAIWTCSIPVKSYMSKTDRSGKAVTCPKGWKESYNQRGWECVQWWRVTVFGARAETCRDHLDKGSWAYFEGRMGGTPNDGTMYPNVWQAADGSYRANYELVASNVEFLGKATSSESEPAEHSAETQTDEIEPENIPF